MEIRRIEEFTRGWIVGDFEPSVFRTDQFEVGYLCHYAGEKWDKHYHKYSKEINYLICGQMIIQGKTLVSGDVFILHEGEVADPEFIEDCEILCIKVPSIPTDKHIVE